MLPLVIANPKSAAGSTRDRWSAIASDLRTHFGPYNVAFTKGPGDGIVIAERASNEGRPFIIACGGDGTINEIANAGSLHRCRMGTHQTRHLFPNAGSRSRSR
jgi:diacylglycerol kinase family enzyme